MSAIGSEIRWELVRCTHCGHERPRQHSMFRQAVLCVRCEAEEMQVLPMAVATTNTEITGFSPADAARTLQAAADQQRAAAADDPDVVRRARKEGRAEGFVQAIDVITATDPLRKSPEVPDA